MEAGSLHDLPKHARYGSEYRRFDYYWGLGVEHETYLMTSQTRRFDTLSPEVMKPERYSVNYYAAYRPEVLKKAIDRLKGPITVPILMNSHSMTRADRFGEHKITYEKKPNPNPRYEGQTLFDWARGFSPWLRDHYERSFVWDGDTVEFMTQRFYKATIGGVLEELTETERAFATAMAKLPRQGLLVAYGPLRIASPVNPPFATYLTNPRNIAMFNNGTLHVNITLPTRLGFNRRPLWWTDFVERHRRLARLIQWVEPLWLAAFGSPDPFSALCPDDGFAAGSQRVAISRYIGLGTFDTERMPTGKILQMHRPPPQDIPWYRHDGPYASLPVIGLDLNFNKHWSHGLEIRLFDQMPVENLRIVLEQLVGLGDAIGRPVRDPRRDPVWISAASGGLYKGSSWVVAADYLNALSREFGAVGTQKEPLTVTAALEWLSSVLEDLRGPCWAYFTESHGSSCWPR